MKNASRIYGKFHLSARVLTLVLGVSMMLNMNLAAMAREDAPETNSSEPTSVEQAEQAAARNGMRLWYRQPVKDWQTEGLVIGNGFFGSVLFGGVDKDRIHLNEKTLWTGGPAPSRNYNGGNRSTPMSKETVKKNQDALENQSYNNGGGNVSDMFGTLNNMGSYQDFADLWVDFAPAGHTEAAAGDYVRDLDLNTGIASVSYQYGGDTFRREYFASYPDKVQVYHFTADSKGKQSFDVSMSSQQSGAKITALDDTITLSGSLSDNGLKYEGQIRVIAKGGTTNATSSGSIQVRNADAVTIVMASGTDYKNDYPAYRGADPRAEITANLDKAAGIGYQALHDRHIEDHYSLFSRVSLDVGAAPATVPTDELIGEYRKGNFNQILDVMVFQFGRYLTIAGSREGALPTNLQGMWGVGSMAWNGDFHFNINVQMNYWPVYITNLAESGVPFVEYVDSLREPGRVTAANSHGIISGPGEENGWIVHTVNNPFGLTAPGGSQEWGWNMGGAAWALQNVYDYYRFTGNVDYLRSTIYPAMREQARFWDSYLIWSAKQNRWVVSPSISPEQGPTSIGTTYDQSLVWQLYKETIEASKILGVDEELRKDWQEKMDDLDPVQIGDQGQIKEWYDETNIGYIGSSKAYNFNAGGADVHRHLSNLVGLYPGNLINKENQTYMDAAKVSLEQRGFEITTGWSKGHRLNLWARTMDGNKSYRMVQAFLTQNARGIMNNLLDSHGSHGGALDSAGYIFQIEGNFGYTSGVAEMLLQSNLGYIQPLPALPDAWPSGSVKGLVARGNFVFDMDWAGSKLSAMTITSRAGGVCEIEYPGIGSATVSGASVQKISNDRISFQTTEGSVYTLSNLPGQAAAEVAPPMSVQAVRTGDETIELIWDNTPGATEYVVYRQKLQTVASGQSAGSVYGTGYERLDTVSANSYTDTAVSAGSIYYYMVAAVTPAGTSSPTAPVEAKKLSVVVTPSRKPIGAGDRLTLKPSVEDHRFVIRYTLDGSVPTASSAKYIGALTSETAGSIRLNAQLFLNDLPVGSMATFNQYGTANLALHKTASSSTPYWGDTYAPGKAVDGNMGTRWASQGDGNISDLIVDLGQVQPLDTVILYEDTSAGMGHRMRAFEIQVSDTGQAGSWTTVYSTQEAKETHECILPVGVAGRYVKYNTVSATKEVTLKEFEIYGWEPSTFTTPSPEAASIRLSAADNVNAGDGFELIFGLSNVNDSIYAQDLTFTYDPSMFEFISAESMNEGFDIVSRKEAPGQVRILAASLGEGNEVNESVDLLKLSFKANSITHSAQTEINLSHVILATGEGKEMQLNDVSHQVSIKAINKTALNELISVAQTAHDAATEGTNAGEYPAGSKAALQAAIDKARAVAENASASQEQVNQTVSELSEALETFKASVITRIPGDLNGDGKVSIGDLALLAAWYGKDSSDPQWEQNQFMDLNDDGRIDIEDLTILARLIIQIL